VEYLKSFTSLLVDSKFESHLFTLLFTTLHVVTAIWDGILFLLFGVQRVCILHTPRGYLRQLEQRERGHRRTLLLYHDEHGSALWGKEDLAGRSTFCRAAELVFEWSGGWMEGWMSG
jgi:hypothetical protein